MINIFINYEVISPFNLKPIPAFHIIRVISRYHLKLFFVIFKHQSAFVGTVLGDNELDSLSAFGEEHIADLDKRLAGLHLQQSRIDLIGINHFQRAFGTAWNQRILAP